MRLLWQPQLLLHIGQLLHQFAADIAGKAQFPHHGLYQYGFFRPLVCQLQGHLCCPMKQRIDVIALPQHLAFRV